MARLAFILVCAMVFVIPWEEAALLPSDQALAQTVADPSLVTHTYIYYIGFLALFLTVVAAGLRGRFRRTPAPLLLLALYVAWNAVSMGWALDIKAAQHECTTLVAAWLFAWMIWQAGDSEKNILWMFGSYLLGCCVSLGDMLVNYRENRATYYTSLEMVRYSGGNLNENSFAAMLAVSVPVAVYLSGRLPPKSRVLRNALLVYVVAAGLGVFLSGSRTGALALGAAFLMMVAQAPRKHKTVLVSLVAMAGATAYLVRLLVSPLIFERLAEGTGANTFAIRKALWANGLEYWMEHPLLGCGVNNFVAVVSSRIGDIHVAHNTFISVLVETGIVGALLLAAVWIGLVRSALRLAGQMDRQLWLAIFAVWAIHASAGSVEYFKSTWLIYGLAMAHCSLARRQAGAPPVLEAS